jgi:hypothetical protein
VQPSHNRKHSQIVDVKSSFRTLDQSRKQELLLEEYDDKENSSININASGSARDKSFSNVQKEDKTESLRLRLFDKEYD